MTELVLSSEIAAPPQRCFDLARSMEFHNHSFAATGERIVSGRKKGLILLGEFVEFEAKHMGKVRRLKAQITDLQSPRRFVDEQAAGDFRYLRHEHLFEPTPQGTRITDRIKFHIGWGPLGLLVERRFIKPHLLQMLITHQANLKQTLESDDWRKYFESPGSTAPSSGRADDLADSDGDAHEKEKRDVDLVEMNHLDVPQLVEAVRVWTGWGLCKAPSRDDARLANELGNEVATNWLPLIKSLERDFYSSDAWRVATTLQEMEILASDQFRRKHPSVADEIVKALAWCYTFDFK